MNGGTSSTRCSNHEFGIVYHIASLHDLVNLCRRVSRMRYLFEIPVLVEPSLESFT